MQLTVYDNPQAFYDKALPFLFQHEAENCVLIGLATIIAKNPATFPDPYLAVIEDAGEVVAIYVYTPPRRPLLSKTSHPGVISLLVDDLATRYRTLNGVIGLVDLAREFAELWQARTGQTGRISIKERVFRLETVNPAAGVGVPGQLRRAKTADRDLLVRWWYAFAVEAIGDGDLAEAEHSINTIFEAPISMRGIYLWEDKGEAVSLAGYTGPTPNGIRVGPVYTPPEFRGHGYASACVAQMSQILLDEGRKYCFLFTDLSNSTSNHIYQTIGYQPAGDVDMYNFD